MSGRNFRKAALALSCASAAALTAAPAAMAGETAVGLTDTVPSTLVTFPVAQPGSTATAGITFPAGTSALDQDLVGLDYRPRSNQLYAYGLGGSLFVLTPPVAPATTWTAVLVSDGIGIFPPADTGLDFNPAADAIRVVNEADQNYRFNPLNGSGGAGTAAGGRDTDLNPGTPSVVAAGYTNNFDGTTSTELFDIDAGSDMLFRQNPPNAGTLEPRGMLGVDTTETAGLDIAQGSTIAYAALDPAGAAESALYTINLANGAATAVGDIGGTDAIESLSVVPASVISFAVGASSVSESSGQAQIAVVRSGPENRAATVDYSSTNGGPSGTLTFAPGQTTQTITVPVTANATDEADRQIALTLGNAGANAIVGGVGATTLSVLDDDDKKASRITGGLRLSKRLLDRGSANLTSTGGGRVTFKLSKADRRALARALRRGKGRSLTLRVRVR